MSIAFQLEFTVSLQLVVISLVFAIDEIEQLGKCRRNFNFYGFYYIQENEGVWFPQYRSSTPNDDRYTCHTVYERMYYDDGIELLMDSYYTKDNVPLKWPHMEDFVSGERRGILMDDTSVPNGNFIPGYGSFRVYNYVVGLTEEFRVRYICADYAYADENTTTVYVETRNSHPSVGVIEDALEVLRRAGLYGPLNRIEQNNCTRPTVHDGYIDYA